MAENKPKAKQVANLKELSPTQKFVRRFFNTDIKGIAQNALGEVIMPNLKNLGLYIVESFFDGQEGNATRTISSKSTLRSNNQTNYSSKFHYKSSNGTTDYTEISKPDYDKIVLNTREDAVNVLDSMTNWARKYGEVTRLDLYTFIGVTGDFQDDKWGWKEENWRDYTFRRVRDGYQLILPPIDHLD